MVVKSIYLCIPHSACARLLFSTYSYTNILWSPLKQQPFSLIKLRCRTHDIIAISLKKSDNISLDFIKRFTAIGVLSENIPYKKPFHKEHINNRWWDWRHVTSLCKSQDEVDITKEINHFILTTLQTTNHYEPLWTHPLTHVPYIPHQIHLLQACCQDWSR